MLWTKRRTEDGVGARWRSSWLTQDQGEGTQPRKWWRWWDKHLTKDGAYSEHQKVCVTWRLSWVGPFHHPYAIYITLTSLFWTPERQHYLALVRGLASAAKVVSTCPGLSCTSAPVEGWFVYRQYMFKRNGDWWIRHRDKLQTRPNTCLSVKFELSSCIFIDLIKPVCCPCGLHQTKEESPPSSRCQDAGKGCFL